MIWFLLYCKSPILSTSFIPLHLKAVQFYRLTGAYAALLAADVNLVVHAVHPFKVGQEIMTVQLDKAKVPDARRALQKAAHRLPCACKVIVE